MKKTTTPIWQDQPITPPIHEHITRRIIPTLRTSSTFRHEPSSLLGQVLSALGLDHRQRILLEQMHSLLLPLRFPAPNRLSAPPAYIAAVLVVGMPAASIPIVAPWVTPRVAVRVAEHVVVAVVAGSVAPVSAAPVVAVPVSAVAVVVGVSSRSVVPVV
jgi:hypothetical protein